MISFKNNQDAKPLFDYYVETDLDSFDDQPVDYSKKYSDQDSYEECRRRKSSIKSNELPSEVSQTLKQVSNDEVKVYCIEGTPLTISYASSLSDLREIGTNFNTDKSDAKDSFASVSDEGCTTSFDVNGEKNTELLGCTTEESPFSKEKEDIKEGKSVSFRNSTDISKASSPLMFSRSSSIGSLTSFEQQSIIDDRSSVSVFSALTSGLISPSDLPDSPGELMSPTLTDKDSISKIDVTKIDSDNECENNELEKHVDSHPKETLLNDIQNEITEIQLSETKVHAPLDLNKISEDDQEIEAQPLETSADSLDEVFKNPDYENNNSFSLKNGEDFSSKSDDESDDDDILLQQCIELGMPSNTNEIEQDLKVTKKICSAHLQTISDSNVITDNIESKMPDTLKSAEDSDEELLQHCIQLGMPESKTNRVMSSSDTLLKETYSSHSTSYKPEKLLDNQACAKSDDDFDDDDDDIMLEQCIELGMPKNAPENVMGTLSSRTIECHSANVKVTASQQCSFKDTSKSYQLPQSNINTNIIPASCQQYRRTSTTTFNVSPNHKPVNIRQPSPAKKVPKVVYRKPCVTKPDTGSHCDENELLLQRVIEMGMPKDFSEKKITHSGIPRKPEFGASQFLFHPINGTRDNCPDGVSDGGDEDEAILDKCIRAGMPSPKLNHNTQNKLPYFQTKHMFQKQPTSSRLIMPTISSESSKKCNSIRLPPNQSYAAVHSSGIWISNTSFIDVDSMRVFRTEDTPVLSPTDSVSDLSSLSINESFLNNSRNSDCSSESDDDELLQQCIRSGMPEAKRAVA